MNKPKQSLPSLSSSSSSAAAAAVSALSAASSQQQQSCIPPMYYDDIPEIIPYEDYDNVKVSSKTIFVCLFF